MMNSSLRVSALIAATALVAACGGGGGGGSAPTPPTSGSPSPSNPTPTNPGPSNPAPVNDAEQYKGFLGASLGLVLGLDHVGKTMFALPEKIRAEVEQHGPTTKCSHSACPPEVDTSQWVTFPVENGTVRLQEWEEIITKDGLLSGDEFLKLDIKGLGDPALSSTVSLYTPGANGTMALSFLANHELTRQGLQLNGDASKEFGGSFNIKLNNEGKLEMRDHPQQDAANVRQLIFTEREDQGNNVWLVNYLTTTNPADLDSVTFDIDMANYIGGGRLKLKTESPLDFGILNGKMALESGSFIYENVMADKHVIVRTSVDADPAFLKVDIDENADGTYDKTGRLAQGDFDFHF